ncbi:MAG: hypothetical protein J6B23_09260, partial [Clostridia bacterium]|nr:hypothetical protein [Clostridia bacterium]
LKASEIWSIFPAFLSHSIKNFLILKFYEPQNLENRDFSRRKLSAIRGMAISDNEEKACFQVFEAGSDNCCQARKGAILL